MAHQYGWTLDYIMDNVYPVDFFLLSRQIKMRQVDEFLMQLRITSHPHASEEAQQELADSLIEQRDWYHGDPSTRDKFDRSTMAAFKAQVKANSRFGKVRQKGEKKDNEVLE